MAIPECLFCKIAAKEISSEMIYEDDIVIAIKDIAPAAPVHILIIPREHIPSLDAVSGENKELLGHIQLTAANMARKLGIAEQGYRLVTNCGPWGGQAVFHLHYHLLGGKMMGWPPE